MLLDFDEAMYSFGTSRPKLIPFINIIHFKVSMFFHLILLFFLSHNDVSLSCVLPMIPLVLLDFMEIFNRILVLNDSIWLRTAVASWRMVLLP